MFGKESKGMWSVANDIFCLYSVYFDVRIGGSGLLTVFKRLELTTLGS